MASAEGKNFGAIVKAKEQHNKNCPFPPHTVRMNPFEIERMQWEEGDTIAGLVLEGDGRVGTGSFRLICDGMEPPELDIEETEVISGPAEPVVVPVGPNAPHEDEEPPRGPRFANRRATRGVTSSSCVGVRSPGELHWVITVRRTAMLLPACCALALAACGDDEQPPPAAGAASAKQKAPTAGGGEGCEDVKVPGHQAIDVKATGVECATAEKVAAAAGGRSRAPYESGGFSCAPSDASGGDTNYSCSMGAARITFLYGTV